tara:strand:+ start:107 stop:517 length:411 start_codon:yes stop_codon:yes gene_type:complete
MSTRRQEVINLVMRQTDYTEEQVKEKLVEWNNNYINVIKEYLNPSFQKKKPSPEKSKTLNQQMMGEIRNFMDDVYVKFENRKKYNQYATILNNLREQQEKNNQSAPPPSNDSSNKQVSEKEDESINHNEIKIEEVV